MTHLKRILLIMIPLALLLVVWVVLTALGMVNSRARTGNAVFNDAPNEYIGAPKAPQKQPKKVQQNKVKRQKPTPIQKPKTDTLLNSWQDSAHIKHATYTPQEAPQPPIVATSSAEQQNTNQAVQQKEQSNIQTFIDAWAWAPSSKNNTKQPQASSTPQSEEITAMKTFGNAYGARIKELTKEAGDQNEILRNFVKDRNNTEDHSAYIALTDLAGLYSALSTDLALLWVPQSFDKPARALSQSYQNINTSLWYIAGNAETDTELLQSIYKYNGSVDGFATSFVQIAELFGAYGVTFGPNEGGSIFTPPALSL